MQNNPHRPDEDSLSAKPLLIKSNFLQMFDIKVELCMHVFAHTLTQLRLQLCRFQ